MLGIYSDIVGSCSQLITWIRFRMPHITKTRYEDIFIFRMWNAKGTGCPHPYHAITILVDVWLHRSFNQRSRHCGKTAEHCAGATEDAGTSRQASCAPEHVGLYRWPKVRMVEGTPSADTFTEYVVPGFNSLGCRDLLLISLIRVIHLLLSMLTWIVGKHSFAASGWSWSRSSWAKRTTRKRWLQEKAVLNSLFHWSMWPLWLKMKIQPIVRSHDSNNGQEGEIRSLHQKTLCRVMIVSPLPCPQMSPFVFCSKLLLL